MNVWQEPNYNSPEVFLKKPVNYFSKKLNHRCLSYWNEKQSYAVKD